MEPFCDFFEQLLCYQPSQMLKITKVTNGRAMAAISIVFVSNYINPVRLTTY